MGGTGLAAPRSAADAPALLFLQQASELLSTTPSGEGFWVGAAYIPPTPGATLSADGSDTGWARFPTLSKNHFGELMLNRRTASEPLGAGEAAWGPGFPKQIGARFVGIEPGSPLESCVSLRWQKGAAAAVWENYACSSRVVRFFVRPFHFLLCTRALGQRSCTGLSLLL